MYAITKKENSLLLELYDLVLERRDINSAVEGIDIFLSTIKDRYSKLWAGRSTSPLDNIIEEIKRFIELSGCPAIKFENLTGALGISKTDYCIINSNVLGTPLHHLLYVVYHEVVHQYQYSKHGEDIALEIFLEKIPLEDAVKALKRIENTTDKYAILKVKQLYKMYIPEIVPNIYPYYKYVSDESFGRMIVYYRFLVKENKLTNTIDINNMIYNSVRHQITDATLQASN